MYYFAYQLASQESDELDRDWRCNPFLSHADEKNLEIYWLLAVLPLAGLSMMLREQIVSNATVLLFKMVGEYAN